MGRREAREKLFNLVFEMSFKSAEEIEAVVERETSEGLSSEYIVDSLRGIYNYIESIDAKIAEYSKDWKIERISRVSRSVMRVSVYEMLYASVPYQVAINEAINLVKKYDDEKAPKFVNGVLNNIAQTEIVKDKTK